VEQEVVVSFGEHSPDYSFTAPQTMNVTSGDTVQVVTRKQLVNVRVMAVYPEVRQITICKGFALSGVCPVDIVGLFTRGVPR
jgi:hypothetical protein